MSSWGQFVVSPDRGGHPGEVEAVRSLVTRIQSAEHGAPNVIKVNTREGRFSLLTYPDFDEDPFPRLAASWLAATALQQQITLVTRHTETSRAWVSP